MKYLVCKKITSESSLLFDLCNLVCNQIFLSGVYHRAGCYNGEGWGCLAGGGGSAFRRRCVLDNTQGVEAPKSSIA